MALFATLTCFIAWQLSCCHVQLCVLSSVNPQQGYIACYLCTHAQACFNTVSSLIIRHNCRPMPALPVLWSSFVAASVLGARHSPRCLCTLCCRVLIFGVSSNGSVMQVISQGAAELAQELCGGRSKNGQADTDSDVGTVTSLLQALLIGVPCLAQTELQAACTDVLKTMHGTSASIGNGAAANALADKLRSVLLALIMLMICYGYFYAVCACLEQLYLVIQTMWSCTSYSCLTESCCITSKTAGAQVAHTASLRSANVL